MLGSGPRPRCPWRNVPHRFPRHRGHRGAIIHASVALPTNSVASLAKRCPHRSGHLMVLFVGMISGIVTENSVIRPPNGCRLRVRAARWRWNAKASRLSVAVGVGCRRPHASRWGRTSERRSPHPPGRKRHRQLRSWWRSPIRCTRRRVQFRPPRRWCLGFGRVGGVVVGVFLVPHRHGHAVTGGVGQQQGLAGFRPTEYSRVCRPHVHTANACQVDLLSRCVGVV